VKEAFAMAFQPKAAKKETGATISGLFKFMDVRCVL